MGGRSALLKSWEWANYGYTIQDTGSTGIAKGEALSVLEVVALVPGEDSGGSDRRR